MRWRASALAASLAGAAAAAPPDSVETFRETRARDAQAVPMRPFGAEPFLQTVEGAVTLQAWRLPEGVTSLQAAREEQTRREAEGWRTVLFCAAAECGGFDFRRALMVLAPPAMRMDLFDFHQLTMRRDGVVLSVLSSEAGRATFQQAVMVETDDRAGVARDATPPAVAEPAPGPSSPPAPALAASPSAALPADPPPDRAAALGALLDRDGRAALEGVDFATGAATPDASSAATLDAAAAMLAARPGLSVAVVGHTDGEGPLAINQRVSAARAQAVLEALAARGVARARMEAAGAGWMAPRAPNLTEAGRALNRRVELVAR